MLNKGLHWQQGFIASSLSLSLSLSLSPFLPVKPSLIRQGRPTTDRAHMTIDSDTDDDRVYRFARGQALERQCALYARGVLTRMYTRRATLRPMRRRLIDLEAHIDHVINHPLESGPSVADIDHAYSRYLRRLSHIRTARLSACRAFWHQHDQQVHDDYLPASYVYAMHFVPWFIAVHRSVRVPSLRVFSSTRPDAVTVLRYSAPGHAHSAIDSRTPGRSALRPRFA